MKSETLKSITRKETYPMMKTYLMMKTCLSYHLSYPMLEVYALETTMPFPKLPFGDLILPPYLNVTIFMPLPTEKKSISTASAVVLTMLFLHVLVSPPVNAFLAHLLVRIAQDLVLKPPPSKEAAIVSDSTNIHQPHQMTHLIMGDLGNEEILLLACDDGDVLAYYNSKIAMTLLNIETGIVPTNPTDIEPFFHQNVGISAWGLAVHKKSRLIAVSNNRHEVHVFAMALTDPQYTSSEVIKQPYKANLFIRVVKDAEGRVKSTSEIGSHQQFMALVKGTNDRRTFFRQRQDAYHFVLETGIRGDNMPSVAFGNDSEGDAVDILAVDILGQLWFMNIWSLRDHPPWYISGLHKLYHQSMYERNGRHRIPLRHPTGWGVLILPESSFLPTNTFKESLGLNPSDAVYVNNEEYGHYIGTRECLKYVKDKSTLHPWTREKKVDRFGTLPHFWDLNSPLSPDWYHPIIDLKDEWGLLQDEAADESTEPHLSLPGKEKEETYRGYIRDGSSVMRFYEMDIELVGGGTDDHKVGIMCTDTIFQEKPMRAAMPGVNFPPERFSHLLHVPELCLVVAGSLCGRVVLITLTRPTNPCYSFKRGFRIEAILPRRTDEDRHLRPICPLLGVAIGPIPSAGGKPPNQGPLGEHRYRIMLHYYDHRILSYDIYRNMMTSELSVI
ncbi:hypothetical protein F4803DRAFT_502259 [Xylaria telfairii]|nr:hypothetical protein F4803DRAFT_502259 [Xylaria telfairii]